MNVELQRENLRVCLRNAIRKGIDSRWRTGDLKKYLIDICGLREDVVTSDLGWLWDTYHEEKEQSGNLGLLTPSQSADSSAGPAEAGPDEEGGQEDGAARLPEIISEVGQGQN